MGTAVLKIWPGEAGPKAPISVYWACSISNTIGPACGMLALKYIGHPAQVCVVGEYVRLKLVSTVFATFQVCKEIQ